MNEIRSVYSLNRFYFRGYILFLVAALTLLLFMSKAGSFLFLNAYHNRPLDIFFITYTNLGDGIFSIVIVLVLLATRRFNIAWQVLAAYVISGLLSQVVKNLVFSPRPKEFFVGHQHIYLIQGITLTGSSSFPSGHTASIFALVTILALFTKSKKLSFLYLIAAILVAFSRIYLSQHFLNDVLAGSFIGVSVSIFVYSFFNTRIAEWRIKRKMEKQKAAVIIEKSQN
ncbi:MAG TPA: phosphatase PAP2 family protein [Puia sp.]|nr:phosphatase PAP2 family protein [Puia sp.]